MSLVKSTETCDVGCGQTSVEPPAPQTVRQALDARIESLRNGVESACIAKAKCETLGILDHPMRFYQDLVFNN